MSIDSTPADREIAEMLHFYYDVARRAGAKSASLELGDALAEPEVPDIANQVPVRKLP